MRVDLSQGLDQSHRRSLGIGTDRSIALPSGVADVRA
jgi:hypothetical protein